MRYNVTFSTTLPVDLDVHPAGEEIAVWLSEQLAAQGWSYPKIENHDDFAWSLNAERKAESTWLLVGHVGDPSAQWLLQVNGGFGCLGSLFGWDDSTKRDALAMAVHDILAASPDFTDVAWHEGDFAEGTGADAPDSAR